MKIISIQKTTCELIETDESEQNLYRRNDNGNWECLMNNSWESIYPPDDKELEEEYQRCSNKQ